MENSKVSSTELLVSCGFIAGRHLFAPLLGLKMQWLFELMRRHLDGCSQAHAARLTSEACHAGSWASRSYQRPISGNFATGSGKRCAADAIAPTEKSAIVRSSPVSHLRPSPLVGFFASIEFMRPSRHASGSAQE